MKQLLFRVTSVVSHSDVYLRLPTYQLLLQETASEYDLYLAIDDITYTNFFRRDGMDFLVRSSQINFFVVNIDEREIAQWIS